MKIRYVSIIALLVVLLAFSGLASAETAASTNVTPTANLTAMPATNETAMVAPAPAYPMNVTDHFGITTTLDKAPERIVSLSPANTEILFAIGLGDKIVGVTDFCDYPAEAKNITHVSGYSGVSYEKIMAVNPDVIIAEDIIGQEAVTSMREKGLKVIEVKNNNISSIKENIVLIGKITGAESNATALVADMDARLANISQKAGNKSEAEKPTVLLLAGYLSGQPIYVYGSNTYGDELITLAGGVNTAGDIVEYKVMSSEAIISADPDFIIVPVDGTMTTEKDFNDLKNANESWMQSLTAVKTGRVIAVDGNLMMHPGPRLTDAGLIIAEEIHKPRASPTPAATPGFEAALVLLGLIGIAFVTTRNK